MGEQTRDPRSTGSGSADLDQAAVEAGPVVAATPAAVQTEREFKYYRSEVRPVTVTQIAYELDVDVRGEQVEINSRFQARVGDNPITELVLNAKDLELKSIIINIPGATPEQDLVNDLIRIKFAEELPPGTEIKITSSVVVTPSKKNPDGLYFDGLPPSDPPQLITQCQQWGLQKIIPCIDEMNAKATFVTKIVADARYTHLICNGSKTSDCLLGDGRREVVYDNTASPMPPYIFFMGCGRWQEHSREIEYPDGSTKQISILALDENERNNLDSLNMTHDSLMFVHLFMGPEKHKDLPQKRALWDLIQEREAAKELGDTAEIARLRSVIRERAAELQLGHKYVGGDTYYEIAMRKSRYGGMENRGTTTIKTSIFAPFPEVMLDMQLLKILSVKAHEFYHDLNGSEVTGTSPFEIWLNEAVTVYVDRKASEFFFGKDFARLRDVQALYESSRGAIANDTPGVALSLESEGFNDPTENITQVVYGKGPEFISMVEAYIGEEGFSRGLALYYERHRGGNASREDWVAAMEEGSGVNLKRFAEVWLKQAGYPTIDYDSAYDSETGTYTLTLRQTGFPPGKHWEFPLPVALCDATGKEFAAETLRMDQPEQTFVFKGLSEAPAYLSLNRDHRLYGRLNLSQVADAQLIVQVKTDNDISGRYLAFRELADREKMRLLDNPDAEVSEQFVELSSGLLTDQRLTDAVGSGLLSAIDEDFSDPRYSKWYVEKHEISRKIKQAIARAHRDEILELYRSHSTSDKSDVGGSYYADLVSGIKQRSVKNTCLSWLTAINDPEAAELALNQYQQAYFGQDKFLALSAYLHNESASLEDRAALVARAVADGKSHPLRWETTMRILGANRSVRAVEILKTVEDTPGFSPTKSDDLLLYTGFAGNRLVAHCTKAGRQFLAQKIIEVAHVDQMPATAYVKMIGIIDGLRREEDRIGMVGVVLQCLDALDPGENDTIGVYNNLRGILRVSPESVRLYQSRMPRGIRPAYLV